MLRISLYDMVPFIIIVSIIVLVFSQVDRILIQGKEKDMNSHQVLYRFGKNYQIIFGENPLKQNMTNYDWVLYFIFTIILNIVAFNLLISLISNTFDRV